MDLNVEAHLDTLFWIPKWTCVGSMGVRRVTLMGAPGVSLDYAALREFEAWTAEDPVGDLRAGVALVAARSKLRSFLTVGGAHNGDDAPPRRLKQWPGKDSVQALAVWWIASALVEERR